MYAGPSPASTLARSARHTAWLLTPSSPALPEVTRSARVSTVSDSGTERSSKWVQYTSMWSVPSLRRLSSTADLMAFSESPSAFSRPVPGAAGRPPTLVLRTISERLPRAASQRPRTASLSSPVPPSTQNA